MLNARGSWRGKSNPNEPKPANGAPARPKGLSPAARKVWDATVKIIAPGVLTKDCGQSLARYCHGLVRWWKLAEWLDTNDEIFESVDKLGNQRFSRHPNLISYEGLGRDLNRLEQEMGLTPASRTRVQTIKGVHEEDDAPQRGIQPILKIAQ